MEDHYREDEMTKRDCFVMGLLGAAVLCLGLVVIAGLWFGCAEAIPFILGLFTG